MLKTLRSQIQENCEGIVIELSFLSSLRGIMVVFALEPKRTAFLAKNCTFHVKKQIDGSGSNYMHPEDQKAFSTES